MKNFTLNLTTGIKMMIVCLFLSIAGHATIKIYPTLTNLQGCQFNYSLQVKQPGDTLWRTVPLYNALVTNTSGAQVNTTVGNFDCDGPLDVKITFSATVTSANVYPSSMNVTPVFSGNTITFTISGPKKFYVDINGDHYNNCMHIIADPLEVNPPQPGDPNVIYIPTGTYVDSAINLQSGQTLYVAGGAAVKGIYANSVSNVKILGRGFIYRAGYNAIEIKHSDNVTLDGLIDLNHGWDGGGGCGINCGTSSNVSISNTVSFSSKKWGDGYDIFSSNGVIVNDVFIRTNDDAITFYGGGKTGNSGDCRNITVSNSTLLPDLAQSFHTGVYGDLNYSQIRDVTCSNIDICNWNHSGRAAIAFTVGDSVRAANFHFNDVRVQNFVDVPLINMSIFYNSTYNYNPGLAIDSIFYTNVRYTGIYTPSSSINGYSSTRRITNVFFTDLVINGAKITSAANGNFNIGSYTQNIVFNTSGSTPAVTSSNKANATVGAAFSYAITATNSPVSYGASGLPPGLGLDTTTGIISGTPAAAGTFTVNISATNASGTGILPLTIEIAPTGDLIARYTFDNTAIDSSVNQFTASLNGGTTYVTGAVGNALKLNGSNGYVSMPKNIVGTVNDITIAAWVKPDTLTTSARIFDLGTGTSVYMFLSPNSGSGFPRFAIKNGGSEQGIDGTSPIPAGKWTHVAITLSGNTGTLYVNGNAVGSNTAVTINPSDMGSTTGNYIGLSQFSTDPYFKGSVDEFRIYKKALSAAEILALTTTTKPIITSAVGAYGMIGTAFSYTATANNTASFSATGLPSGLAIDGSTGVISGTPAISGIFPVNLIAANTNGADTALLNLNIQSDVVSNLFVVGGDAKDTLSWDTMTGVTSFNIKRSEVAGGPYAVIANTTTNGFKDSLVVNGHVYYYVVSMIDSRGEHPNSTEVIAAPNIGQAGYYKFDETLGTKTLDYWGGKPGALNNNSSVTRATGIMNSALHFDGTSTSYATMPSGIVSGLSDFTISTWVKTDVAATWQRVFDFGTGTTNYMFLSTNSNTNVVRYAITTGSGEQGINSGAALSTGTWHHIAVTLSGSLGILYVDGVEAGRNTAMTLKPSSLGNTTLNYIGKSQWNDPLLTGTIDELKIFSRALSATEITAMVYQSIAPPAPVNTVVSGSNNNAALSWGASLSATGYKVKRATAAGGPFSVIATITGNSYVDTTGDGCTNYFYAISAINNNGEGANSNIASLSYGKKLTGAVIGTAGSYNNNASTTKEAAVDGNINTYFDAAVGTAWVGYDLGEGNSTIIKRIRYAPRANNQGRMVGGMFQGANVADFSTATTLFTVTVQPASGAYTEQAITDTGKYRYLRYISTSTGFGNVAEIEFYGLPPGLSGAPSAPATVSVNGGNNKVTVNWAASSYANSYNVKRADSLNGSYSTIATVIRSTSFTDTAAFNCRSFFYKISAVNCNGEGANSAAAGLSIAAKLTGTSIGTSGSWNNDPTTTKEAALDGNINTYFDAASGTAWVGYDLGTGNSAVIKNIRYVPRTNNQGRMVGGMFQGSNTADFSAAKTLFTVTAQPSVGVYTQQTIADTGRYRYVRYISANTGFGNVAEVEFYGLYANALKVNLPDTQSVVYNVPFVDTIAVTNRPDTYSIAGLPAGLELDSCTGTIHGTPVAAGTFHVVVTVSNVWGSAADTMVLIVKNTQAITFGSPDKKVIGDKDFTLTATASSGLPVTYNSSDTTIATVTNSIMHIKAAGAVTVTAYQQGDSLNLAAIPISQNLTVIPFNLQVKYKDGDNNQVTNNIVKPYLTLVNADTVKVAYSELTARYWFTAENYSGISTWIDYAALGNSKVKMKYIQLPQPYNGALGYIEYGFDSTAGNLLAGSNSGEIQSHFANTDWSVFNEADDYSYANNSSYATNANITLYRNGMLVWGVEPTPSAPVIAVKVYEQNPDAAANTNTIRSYINISNEGNTLLSYKDLTVRYWFTKDGTAALNYWIDYAKIGTSKLTGQFTQLNPARDSADTYIELKIDSSAGTLYPLSNTGSIQYRIAKTDWSNFSRVNDYSYVPPSSAFSVNNHITVYYKGSLVYGAEPDVSIMARRISIATPPAAETESKMMIYPNPVTGKRFYIKPGNHEMKNILVKVTNDKGNIIVVKNVKNNRGEIIEITLDNNAAAGIYYVQLDNEPARKVVVIE